MAKKCNRGELKTWLNTKTNGFPSPSGFRPKAVAGETEHERGGGVMMALGIMRRFWKYVYDDLTIFGKIFFFPSAVVMYSLLLTMAILEFILFDIGYFLSAKLEKRETIESLVYYLTHV